MVSLLNWFKALFPPRLPQEAEAAAMVRFRDNDTAENILGFIVKNNNDLTGLIDPRQSYLEKYKNTKYFVYIPSATVPQCAPNDSAEIKVLVSRASQSEKDYLYCEVSALEGDDTVARVGAHLFIPCESVSFNRNSFLSKYSKTVMKSKNLLPVNPTSRESNEARLYGLKNNGEVIDITLVQLRRSDSSVLEVDDNVFDKLIDGPLLNESKTKLVGCLQKDQRKGQLRLDFFGMEDSVHAWKASTLQSRVTESDDSATSADQCSKHDNNGGNGGAIVAAGVNSKIDNSLAVEVSLESSGNVIQPFNLANISTDANGSLGISGQGENGPSVRPEDIDERTTSNGSSPCDSDSVISVALADTASELEEDAKSDAVSDIGGEESGSSNGESAIDDDQLDDVHDHESMNGNDYHEPIQVSKERSLVSEHLPIEEQATDGEKHPNTEELRKEPMFIWKKSSQPPFDGTLDPVPPPAPDTVKTVPDTTRQLPTAGLLKDLLQQNLAVESCLNGLDCEYRVLSNWKQLADRLKAPAEVKLVCNSVTKHSPTLAVLDRPDVSEIACRQFMDMFLKGNLRKDVYDVLKDGIPEDERELSLKDALLSKDELVDDVARRLDAEPASSAIKNWKYYGKKLKIPDDELDLIEREGKNSAEELLLNAYKTLHKEMRTAGKFREIIMGFKNRVDLQNFVNHDLKIKENDHRPLEDILPPDSNQMKKATALLNKDGKGTLPNWKHLAREWGISHKIYQDFDHENSPGPTKKLMEWVCTSNHQVSVQQFLDILGDLPRYDIKEALEKIISKQ